MASIVCAALIGLGARSAGAAIPCQNAEIFCRAGRCAIGPGELPRDCQLDFGDRLLIIAGTLKVPTGGRLALRAGAIDVRRAIIGRHARPFAGAGASISLTARRNLIVNWRIDASARTQPGSIALYAGGDIRLFAPVRAAANGANATATGGTVIMEAGGRISAVRRARIRVEGDVRTAGGEVRLRGSRGVVLHNRIGADGASGGAISIATVNGDILLDDSLSAVGDTGAGGAISVVAVGGRLTAIDSVSSDGSAAGGSILLVGSQDVISFGDLRARSTNGPGGAILMASNADVQNYDTIDVGGRSGGQISLLSSFRAVRTQAPLLADGRNGSGGSVAIMAGDEVAIGSVVNADGRDVGGEIRIAGFDVHLSNRGDLFARGDMGGTVTLQGATLVIDSGARVQVDGDDAPGGTIRMAATEGDLRLSGNFRARGRNGGRIVAQAAGSVVADGEFETRGNGCIALSGATVDLRRGMFDVPVGDACR